MNGQGYIGNPKGDKDDTFGTVVEHSKDILDVLRIKDSMRSATPGAGSLHSSSPTGWPDLVRSLTIVDSASKADYAAIYAELALTGWDPDIEPSLETVAIEPIGPAINRESVTPNLPKMRGALKGNYLHGRGRMALFAQCGAQEKL